jgi:hypothetical protein
MATGGPKRLQKYLPGGLASALSRHAGESSRLQNAWNSIVSEPLASHARPIRYGDGVLYVHAETSAWVSRLRLQQQTLASEFRRRAGFKDLTEIRFRVAPIESETEAPKKRARASRISARAASEIARSAETIEHSELKAALQRLADRAEPDSSKEGS